MIKRDLTNRLEGLMSSACDMEPSEVLQWLAV